MLSNVLGQPDGVAYLRRVLSGELKCPLMLEGPPGVGRHYSVQQAAREGICRKPRDLQANLDQLDTGTHPDWHVLSDDKDIGVEAVRDVLDQLSRPPALGRYRFVVVDSCDRMTDAAANCILKTLEEPPPYVRFFLLCSDPSKVIPTIRSRCGRVRYTKLPEDVILARLSELESDPLRAQVCCRYAQGSLGEAVRFWGSGRLALRGKALTALKGSLSGDWSALCRAVDSVEKELSSFSQVFEHILKDLQIIGHLPGAITNLDLYSDLLGLAPPRAVLDAWINDYYDLPSTEAPTYPLHFKSYLISGGAVV